MPSHLLLRLSTVRCVAHHRGYSGLTHDFALRRNTPYSSVKHSRVIRGADLGHRGVETRGGDSGGAKAPDYDRYDRDTSWGISSPAIPTAEPHYPHQYPSPKGANTASHHTTLLGPPLSDRRLF